MHSLYEYPPPWLAEIFHITSTTDPAIYNTGFISGTYNPSYPYGYSCETGGPLLIAYDYAPPDIPQPDPNTGAVPGAFHGVLYD